MPARLVTSFRRIIMQNVRVSRGSFFFATASSLLVFVVFSAADGGSGPKMVLSIGVDEAQKGCRPSDTQEASDAVIGVEGVEQGMEQHISLSDTAKTCGVTVDKGSLIISTSRFMK